VCVRAPAYAALDARIIKADEIAAKYDCVVGPLLKSAGKSGSPRQRLAAAQQGFVDLDSRARVVAVPSPVASPVANSTPKEGIVDDEGSIVAGLDERVCISTPVSLTAPLPLEPEKSVIKREAAPKYLPNGRRLLQFVQETPDHLVCPICFLEILKPSQCQNGHVFCHTCIVPWLDSSKVAQCPICEVPTTVQTLGRNLVVELYVNDLLIYCPHFIHPDEAPDQQCGWVGKVRELENHLAESCGFEPMLCPNPGCNQQHPRRLVKHHSSADCPYKLESCQLCAGQYAVCDEELHQTVCLKAVIGCPNRCDEHHGGSRLCRGDILTHLANSCPLVIKECPVHQAAGNCSCPGSLTRQAMKQHLSDPSTTINLLNLLVENGAAIHQSLAEIRLANASLGHGLSAMADRIDIYKVHSDLTSGLPSVY
jgi:Zinc finger, C3HC4 type (RING finger)